MKTRFNKCTRQGNILIINEEHNIQPTDSLSIVNGSCFGKGHIRVYVLDVIEDKVTVAPYKITGFDGIWEEDLYILKH